MSRIVALYVTYIVNSEWSLQLMLQRLCDALVCTDVGECGGADRLKAMVCCTVGYTDIHAKQWTHAASTADRIVQVPLRQFALTFSALANISSIGSLLAHKIVAT